MTPKEREAMQQALIYLDAIINGEGVKPYQLEGTAFTLREVLAERHKENCACDVCRGCDNADIKAEQAEHEPVAWVSAKESFCGFPKLVFSETQKDGYKPLYAAPVQQAEQSQLADASLEPVAWAISHSLGLEFGSKYPMQTTKEAAEQMAREHMGNVVVTPLYAAPVRTKDLTDDEIMKINVDTAGIVPTCDRQFHFARAVIAADREKNKND